MTVLLATLAVVALAAGGVWWVPRHGVLRQRLRSSVVVTLKSGRAFRGVLTETDGRVLVLRSAELLASGPDSGSVPVDGEVIVLRGDVEFLQRP